MLNEHAASSDAVGGQGSNRTHLQTETIEFLQMQIWATARDSMLIKGKGYMRTWLLSSTTSVAGVSSGMAVNEKHESELEASLGFITPPRPPPPAGASLQQDNADSSDNQVIPVHSDLQ
jgi:hypothetical protein